MSTQKFKPGDKVRLVKTLPKGHCRFVIDFQERLLAKYKDQIFTVISPYDALVHVTIPQTGNALSTYSWRFELVSDPVEEAKKLLAEHGYTITPPKPREKGKVWIFKRFYGNRGNFAVFGEEVAAAYIRESYELLSVVDWEEGQGL